LQVALGVQMLATHVSPLGQTVPHCLQLLGSLVVSTQPDAQHCVVPEHAGPPLHDGVRHMPWTQVASCAQACPHAEQFAGSLCVSVQPFAQQDCSTEQAGPPLHIAGVVHTLFTQLCPGPQTFPQLSQFLGSLVVSVQPPAQHARPEAHAGFPLQSGPPWQVPATQARPEVQACPHAPQFWTSLFVSAQPEEQHTSSTLHAGPLLQLVGVWHAPATQASPVGHCVPQALQSLGSVCSSTQIVPQHERLPGHVPLVHEGTHL
jgi:hypothetical protein